MAIRVVGYAAAAMGTCAAVPAASLRLIDHGRGVVRKMAARLLRRRADATVRAVTVGGSVGMSAAGSVSVSHRTGGTVDERLARLEQRVQDLGSQQSKTAAELQQETAERRRADAEVRDYVRSEVSRLDQLLADERSTTVEIDARALPVILLGAALGGFPDVLASSPLLGTAAVSLAVGLFFRAWYLVSQHRAATRAADNG
jgi:hypothetical protein